MEAAKTKHHEQSEKRDWTISSLMRVGDLSYRDLDAVYVAFGHMSYEAIASFRNNQSLNPPRPKNECPAQRVTEVAEEVVTRICKCQHHDGGKTELEGSDATSVTLRFTGACTHCPQIKYTANILEGALRNHLPDLDEVIFKGIDLKTKSELPVNRQYTLGAYCKKFSIEPHQLDEAIQRFGKIEDRHLSMIALKAATAKKIHDKN